MCGTIGDFTLTAIRVSELDYGEDLPLGPMGARAASSRCGQPSHSNLTDCGCDPSKPDSVAVHPKGEECSVSLFEHKPPSIRSTSLV